MPTLTIPPRQATVGSLPLGGFGITAGGGSPGKAHGSTDWRPVEGLQLPSSRATRRAGFGVAAGVRRCLTTQMSRARQCSVQAEHHSCPRAEHG